MNFLMPEYCQYAYLVHKWPNFANIKIGTLRNQMGEYIGPLPPSHGQMCCFTRPLFNHALYYPRPLSEGLELKVILQ